VNNRQRNQAANSRAMRVKQATEPSSNLSSAAVLEELSCKVMALIVDSIRLKVCYPIFYLEIKY
jgi:hypothetical protein